MNMSKKNDRKPGQRRDDGGWVISVLAAVVFGAIVTIAIVV